MSLPGISSAVPRDTTDVNTKFSLDVHSLALFTGFENGPVTHWSIKKSPMAIVKMIWRTTTTLLRLIDRNKHVSGSISAVRRRVVSFAVMDTKEYPLHPRRKSKEERRRQPTGHESSEAYFDRGMKMDSCLVPTFAGTPDSVHSHFAACPFLYTCRLWGRRSG